MKGHSYVIRVRSPRAAKGEYDAGRTRSEARAKAAEWADDGASGAIGYFTFGRSDPEDGRWHEVECFGADCARPIGGYV